MMKKIIKTILLMAVLILILCSCGRSDITLTVNKDGSFDAEIVYGINKEFVAGDEVIEQVAGLIKQPLDEKKIEYTEKDEEKFYLITTKKHFKDVKELTNASLWEGISFVPGFSTASEPNALLVTCENGKISFSGTLNSDSFKATELLSENKEAFGASLKIIAEKAKANVKEEKNEKNAYLWQGTANDNVEVQLTAAYPQTEAEKEIPEEEKNEIKNEEKGESEEVNKIPEKEEGKKRTSVYIYIIIAIVFLAVIVVVIIKGKKKIEGKEKGEENNDF